MSWAGSTQLRTCWVLAMRCLSRKSCEARISGCMWTALASSNAILICISIELCEREATAFAPGRASVTVGGGGGWTNLGAQR